MLFVGHSTQSTTDAAIRESIPSTPEPSRQAADYEYEGYGLGEKDRKPTWQEVMHKARVRLYRTPVHWAFNPQQGYCPGQAYTSKIQQDCRERSTHWSPGGAEEFSYHLEIIEDLDDGRLHEDSSGHSSFGEIMSAGIRESIPIYQISKLFYTDTGRILNIGANGDGNNNPVLLLKRDISAAESAPSQDGQLRYHSEVDDMDKTEQEECKSTGSDNIHQVQIDEQLHQECGGGSPEPAATEQYWRFPRHVDPEWIALEVYNDNDDDASSISDPSSLGKDEDTSRVSSQAKLMTNYSEESSPADSALLEPMSNMSLQNLASKSSVGATSSEHQDSLTGSSEHHLVNEKSTAAQSYSNESMLTSSGSPFGTITSSLSLLEMLVRLTSLQTFRQVSHLAIPDHILSFFLEEASTTGVSSITEQQQVRKQAKHRVGFDPYTETPPR
jgi:hypothetical protein